jgi:hypothetical protein
MTETATLSVGIDCGSQVHQVCVLNHAGAIVGERRVGHNGHDLLALAAWLLTLGEPDPTGITVAIEVPHGTIVEMLLERGFPVYALNPKQLDRFRERYTVAGAKDDRRDAWVLASAGQSDRAAFRAVRIDDPAIIELRGLSRLDSELGKNCDARRTNCAISYTGTFRRCSRCVPAPMSGGSGSCWRSRRPPSRPVRVGRRSSTGC